jgi:hypothetical protein
MTAGEKKKVKGGGGLSGGVRAFKRGKKVIPIYIN